MKILDSFDEFHFKNDKWAKIDDKSCGNHDLIKDNGRNACR